METIGNRIQKYRKEKSMTQEALAEKLGVSSQAVSKWETDASCPDISLLPRLCRILGITADELLTGEKNEVRFVPTEQRKPMEDLIFRVRCETAEGDKIRVNLPMILMKLALEIGADVMPHMGGESGEMMKNIDMAKVVLMVEKGLVGKLVEMESADGDRVEVVVE